MWFYKTGGLLTQVNYSENCPFGTLTQVVLRTGSTVHYWLEPDARLCPMLPVEIHLPFLYVIQSLLEIGQNIYSSQTKTNFRYKKNDCNLIPFAKGKKAHVLNEYNNTSFRRVSNDTQLCIGHGSEITWSEDIISLPGGVVVVVVSVFFVVDVSCALTFPTTKQKPKISQSMDSENAY